MEASDAKGRTPFVSAGDTATVVDHGILGPYGGRSGSSNLCAVRLARTRADENANHCAMEPLRSRLRQMVRQVRAGLGGEERRQCHRRSYPGTEYRRAR